MLTEAVRSKLIELINHAMRQTTAFYKTWKESGLSDIPLATSIIRTLSISKGLAHINHLPHIANLAHTEANVIDQIIKNGIPLSETIFKQLTQAHNLLIQSLEKGEDAAKKSIHELLTMFAPYLIHVAPEKQDSNNVFNLSTIGLGSDEIIQLSATEMRILEQTIASHKPLLSYATLVHVQGLEKHLIHTIQKLVQYGTLIAIIPSYPKQQSYDYTFFFIFTSTTPLAQLCKILPLPGSLILYTPEHEVQSCIITPSTQQK